MVNGDYSGVIRYFTNLGGQEPYGSGIIAVLRHGGRATSASIAEFEQDYSQRVADSVVEALQIFCKGNPDVWEHLQEITRCFTSDACPAALKAGRCLSQHFRSLTVIHRDLSHAIRPVVEKKSGSLVSVERKVLRSGSARREYSAAHVNLLQP